MLVEVAVLKTWSYLNSNIEIHKSKQKNKKKK